MAYLYIETVTSSNSSMGSVDMNRMVLTENLVEMEQDVQISGKNDKNIAANEQSIDCYLRIKGRPSQLFMPA